MNYRESYGLRVYNGILFNHESSLRGEAFVTKKIANTVARIATGERVKLCLGNLDARRDWGCAVDFVNGMWKTLQYPVCDDFVLATGKLHSVRDLCDMAFKSVGLSWAEHTTTSTKYVRPSEPCDMYGDYSKAKHCLGWEPTTPLHSVIQVMVEHEIAALK